MLLLHHSGTRQNSLSSPVRLLLLHLGHDFDRFTALAYPSICLLIAATHARTAGHDVFTFEMLYESFRDQVRASQSAPVHLEGGGIGMVNCDREILMGVSDVRSRFQ